MPGFKIILAWYYWITSRNNDLARKRLKHCAACELLKWGVCTQCGCPVQTKSRLEDAECPHPNGNKWKIES
jgi:hypothetical protein